MRRLLTVALLMLPALAAGADEASARHLIYLHGRIVQDQQSARPRHPEFGHYELEAILATFRERGFVVTGEIRPKAASLSDSASHVVGQIRSLLASGAPASHVTVLGGSMGAAIALLSAARLQEPAVHFAVLGACLSRTVPLLLTEYGHEPAGRVLVIREKSDETTEPCPAWTGDTGSGASLVVREIVLDTGQRHGFLYRPLPEWVEPVVQWAMIR